MRGILGIVMLALFGVFLVLKLCGWLLSLAIAGVTGDFAKFHSLLTSAESKKVDAALVVMRGTLQEISPTRPAFEDPSAVSEVMLGYVFAWANLLWFEEESATRERKARKFLQAVFSEQTVDLWVLSGMLTQEGSPQFAEGVTVGTQDFLKMVTYSDD